MLDKNSPVCNYKITVLLRFFCGRVRLYGKRVYGLGGFTKNPVDEPMPVNTAESSERR